MVKCNLCGPWTCGPGDSPQIVKLHQKSRPLRAAFSGAGAGGLGIQAEVTELAHDGPATLRPCPPSDGGRRGGTGDAAHMGPGPLGLSHLLEKTRTYVRVSGKITSSLASVNHRQQEACKVFSLYNVCVTIKPCSFAVLSIFTAAEIVTHLTKKPYLITIKSKRSSQMRNRIFRHCKNTIQQINLYLV